MFYNRLLTAKSVSAESISTSGTTFSIQIRSLSYSVAAKKYISINKSLVFNPVIHKINIMKGINGMNLEKSF